MTNPPSPPAPTAHVVKLPKPSKPMFKQQGGSDYDIVNNVIINQVVNAGWFPRGIQAPESNNELMANCFLLESFKPQDEIEGMLAAQAVAMHNGAMEWARRAMIKDQGLEAVAALRKGVVAYSRAFTDILTALDRKRGKGGQQKVTVEHVHVHAGGQAIVGTIDGTATGGGGGATAETQGEPCGPPARLADDTASGAISTALWGPEPGRESMPVASDAERPVPVARRRKHRPANG